jgi:NAD-dependent deacetylase
MSVARLAELLERRRPRAAKGGPGFRPDAGGLSAGVSSHCVALTGAGISTESGIPDFRSAEGIWAKYDPAEVAHIDAFRRDPARVWEFYALRLDALAQAEPNDGHRALAELEEQGWIRAVITQNVDGLHQRAGSREIVEVHGSLRDAECVQCGVRVPIEDALAELPLPPCPECGEVLKPGVVMFGELLPAQAIERAQALAAEAGLLLVVGSSLEVHPVAALPGETLAAGGALAIVNRGGTPWDSRAELVLDGAAGETLRGLAAALAIVGADPPRRSDG